MAIALRPAGMNDLSLYTNLFPAVINFSSSGDNTVVAGLSGQQVLVFRLFFVVAGATNIIFKDGTGTNLSGALPMLANGGITLDLSNVPWFQTASGNGFVINSSNAVQVSGTIYYQQHI